LNSAIRAYYAKAIKQVYVTEINFKTEINSQETTIKARFNDLPLGQITLISHEKEDQFYKQSLFASKYALVLNPTIPDVGDKVILPFINKPTLRGLSRVYLPYNLNFEGKIKELDGFIRCSKIGYTDDFNFTGAKWLYPTINIQIHLRYI
jgi:hypothetical protein